MTDPVDRAAAVRAVIDVDLERYPGLPRDTARADVIAAAGAPVAETAGSADPASLRTSVHDVGPGRRLTAWYASTDPSLPSLDDPVVALERPIVPGEVEALLEREGHHPRGSQRLTAWPERGLAVWFSARSRLPTILLAFPPMTPEQFDASPMGRRA